MSLLIIKGRFYRHAELPRKQPALFSPKASHAFKVDRALVESWSKRRCDTTLGTDQFSASHACKLSNVPSNIQQFRYFVVIRFFPSCFIESGKIPRKRKFQLRVGKGYRKSALLVHTSAAGYSSNHRP